MSERENRKHDICRELVVRIKALKTAEQNTFSAIIACSPRQDLLGPLRTTCRLVGRLLVRERWRLQQLLAFALEVVSSAVLELELSVFLLEGHRLLIQIVVLDAVARGLVR